MFRDFLLILSQFNWSSALDILLVAIIFYWALILIQGTKAVQLLRGILFVVVVSITITSILDLTAFKWLINKALPALLVGIPVVFQPELRRALERLGRTGNILTLSNQSHQLDHSFKLVASTAHKLSLKRLGALIVLERETGLADYIETGVQLDAVVSEDLLMTIFYNKTALHDGAVIVRYDRIIAASCLLPLSRGETDRHNFGTRHRAALGLTEACDAVVVIVSEETGIISIAHNGRIIRHLDEQRLLKILNSLFRSQLALPASRWLNLKRKLTWNKSIKEQTDH